MVVLEEGGNPSYEDFFRVSTFKKSRLYSIPTRNVGGKKRHISNCPSGEVNRPPVTKIGNMNPTKIEPRIFKNIFKVF